MVTTYKEWAFSSCAVTMAVLENRNEWCYALRHARTGVGDKKFYIYQSIDYNNNFKSILKKTSIYQFMKDKINVKKTNRVKFDTRTYIYQSGIETTPKIDDGDETVTKDPSESHDNSIQTIVSYDDTTKIRPISLESMFERDYLYNNPVTWQTSHTRFTMLSEYSLPATFTQLEGISTYGALMYHALYKSNFKITIRTDATNYHQGVLAIFAVPGNPTVYDDYNNLNHAAIFNYPHVLLNLGLTSEVSFEVPYGQICNVIPPNHRDDYVMARVYLMVLSPLQAGTSASTSVNLSIWFRPIKPYLSVKTTFMVAQGKDMIGSIVKPISHAILDNFSLPFGDQLKQVGKIFGIYDRVAIDDQENESARCADAPIRVVNTKFNQLEVIPYLPNRLNSNDISDLVQIAQNYALASVMTWSTNNQPGTILEQVAISPSCPMMIRGASATNNTYYTTNIAGIASLFRFYRGSINVRLQIVASSFHRGNLWIAFDPYGDGSPTPQQIYGLPGISMAIGGNEQELCVKLPYSKHRDYLPIDWVDMNVDNQLGRLYIVVQNALIAPVNVSTSVEILLYVAAGDDAEFRFPMTYGERIVKHQQIVDGVMTFQGDVKHFYEQDKLDDGFIIGQHSNILNLMRRPEYMHEYNTPLGIGANEITYTGGRLSDSGLHAIVSELFKYSSGGTIVHYVTNTNRAQNALAYFEYYPRFRSSTGPTVTPVTAHQVFSGAIHDITRDPTVNFLLPGYNTVPYFYNVPYLMNDTPQGELEIGWAITTNISSSTANPWRLHIGNSVADDYRFYCPMSMFQIAIPIGQEMVGALIPPNMPINLWNMSATGNVYNPTNAFDRALNTYATIGVGTTAHFTINMPPSNGYELNKVFLYMTASGVVDASCIVSVRGTNSTGTYTLVSDKFANMIGYLSVNVHEYYDSIALYFDQTPNQAFNIYVYEFQIYNSTDPSIMPVMTSYNTPTGYTIVSSDYSGGEMWKGFSDGRWYPLTSTGNSTIALPDNYVINALSCRVVSGGTASLTLSGSVDGSTYVTIGSCVLTVGANMVYFRNTNAYNRIRINYAVTNAGLYNIQFYGKPAMVPQTGIVDTMADTFKTGLEKVYELYQTVKRAINSILAVGDVSSMITANLPNVVKAFKLMYKILDLLTGVVSGLYTVMAESTVVASCGLMQLMSKLLSFSELAQLKDGFVYESNEDAAWNVVLERVKGVSESLYESLRKYFNPNVILGVIQTIFSKMGYDTKTLDIIYRRERYLNPDTHFVITAFMSCMIYTCEGVANLNRFDSVYHEDLALYVNNIREVLDNYDYFKKYVLDGISLSVKDYLGVMRLKAADLRARESYVHHKKNSASSLETYIDKLRDKIGKSTQLTTSPEPVSLTFMGNPGNGKTILATYLVPSLLNTLLKDVESYKDCYKNFDDEHTYAVNYQRLVHTMVVSQTLKYDSLYNQQPFILMDDAFTGRDDMDACNLTRISNVAKMEVSKAQIDDKGETYNAKFIIVTTNSTNPVRTVSAYINEPLKIARRLGMIVEVVLKDNQNPVCDDDIRVTPESTIEERIEAISNLLESKYTFKLYEYPRPDNGRVASIDLQYKRNIQFKEMIMHLKNEHIRKSAFIGKNINTLAMAPEWHPTSAMVTQTLDGSDTTTDIPDIDCALGRTTLIDELVCPDARTIELARQMIEKYPEYSEIIQDDPAIPTYVKEMLRPIVEVPKRKWIGITNYLQRMVKKLDENKYKIAAGLVGAFAVGATVQAMYSVCKKMAYVFQNLVYDNKAIVKPNNSHLPAHNYIPQDIGLDVKDIEIIKKIRKNIVKISWRSSPTSILGEQYAMYVDNQTILINKHFFFLEKEHMDKGGRIYITMPSVFEGDTMGCKPYAIPIDQRKDIPSVDLYICTLSVVTPNVSNIRKHIIQDPKVTNRHGILLGCYESYDKHVDWTGYLSNRPMYYAKLNQTINNDLYEVSYREDASGRKQNTIFGDCGRPYYVLGHGIAGIHAAADLNHYCGGAAPIRGLSDIVVPERIAEVRAQPANNSYWFSQSPLYSEVIINGEKLSKYVSRHSAFERIPCLINEDECDYHPTAKVANGTVDPLITGAQKWETDKASGIPLRYIRSCAQYFIAKLDSFEYEPKVWTLDETINGNGSTGPLNMKTSSGMWQEYFGCGKRKIFDVVEVPAGDPQRYCFSHMALTRKIPHKTFVEIVSEKDELLRRGVVPIFPFISTLKDELRPQAKVLAGNTRVFEQGSLDLVLLCRKYFGSFVDVYRSHPGFKLYHGIGRDKDAVWAQYALGLRGFSDYGQAFDYKNFDGSLPAECYTFFREVTDRYYENIDTPEDKLARHSLLYALQNGIHVMNSLVFESTQGNKSGAIFTDVFNSLANTFLIWMSFISFSIKNDLNAHLTEFDASVRMLTYGDDVVMSVKKSILDKGYDALYIQSVMRELGVTITSAEKGKDLEPYIDINNVTFLKSPFIYDSEADIWVAPLPIPCIIRELKYRPSSAKENTNDLGDRCTNVMRFLAHHPREVFCYWQKLLARRGKRLGLAMYLALDYDSLRSEIRGKQSVEAPIE